MLAPHRRVGARTSGKSWIRHCLSLGKQICFMSIYHGTNEECGSQVKLFISENITFSFQVYDSKTLLQYCKPKSSLEKLVLRIAFLTLSNNISYLQYRNMATKRYSTTHASLQNNLHHFNIFFFAAYAKSYTFHGGTRAVSVYHTSVDHYCVPSIYHT